MESKGNIEWFYDYLVQFLKSPGWSLLIVQFIDDHCIHFTNDQENKLMYSSIFEVISIQDFKKMIDSLLENLLKELNISPELFLQIVDMGMSSPSDRKVFEQLIACESFMSFKKLMIRQNKGIEVEVIKSMKTEGIATDEDLDLALEKQEIAEVGYALAMSIAWEEEQRLKARQAEEDLQKALKESEAEYRMQMSQAQREEELRRKQREEEDRLAIEKLKLQEEERLRLLREKERLEAEALQKKENDEKNRAEAERRRIELEKLAEEERKKAEADRERQLEEMRRLQREKELEDERRREELRLKTEEYKRQKDLELMEIKRKADEERERLRLEIEALNMAPEKVERSSKPRMSLIPMQNMNLGTDILDLNKGRIDLTKELQEAENLRIMTQGIMRKTDNKRETVAQRDEKMLKQREIIMAKKKLEREEQMKEFKDSGGIDLSQDTENAKDTGGFTRKRNSILDAKRASFKEKRLG